MPALSGLLHAILHPLIRLSHRLVKVIEGGSVKHTIKRLEATRTMEGPGGKSK